MKKRIISFAASLSLIGSVIAPINALADEETTASFTGDGYTVTYEVKSGWGHNQNVEVTLTNTSNEPLLNWALIYDAQGEINGIWNGVIFDSNESSYVIKNSGYNYEILPENSVTFGYTLTGDELDIPESITLCSQREDVDTESYSVSLSVSDDWGSGFNGLITIENLSDRPIEAWRLGFDANFEISNVWNAQLLSSDNNSYSVCSDITTTPIGVGETKTFGFAAVKDQDSIPEITNTSLSEVAINADLTDHNDDSSEYSDDSSSENDDSSETDSSDVSSEPDSSDESSEYEEPVVRQQTYTYSVRNEDCAVDEITVSMETAGDLEGTTTIENIMDKDIMCSGVVGLFGEPFDIETSAEFSSAVLTFKVDKSMLGDTEFDNLLFLWYDEENENFVELDTEHDEENSTVSTTVTHFSKYMIVDGLAWYTNWQNIARTMQGFLYPSATILIETCTDENDPSRGEIRFTIDGANGTTTAYSPKTYREQIKHHLLSLMHDYDLLQLTCAAYLHVIDPVDNYYDTFSMFMTSDKNYLKSGSFYSDTDFTNIGYALSNCSSDFSGYPEYLKRIIIVTDRDLTCDPYEIASSGYGAISTDIPVYFICIGEFETIGLQNIINHCGGAIYSISSESEFITFLQTWDMLKMRAEQDTDGDGLLDYFEINGIPLANGQLLTGCDYEKKHSDWDGLADNEEIIPRLQYSPITLTFDGEPFITEGYYFKMNSDPTLEDTDGDGLFDYYTTLEYKKGDSSLEKDNRPLTKGIYFSDIDSVITGEMTIVSCSNGLAGHAFLVYKSYINDTLDFTKFTCGYEYKTWVKTDSCEYSIKKNEYVAIGNAGKGVGGSSQLSEGSSSGDDGDDAGIYFNREFAVEYNNYISNYSEDDFEEEYDENNAYTKRTSSYQLETIIDYCADNNYYNLLTNNCANVAVNAWNEAFKTDNFKSDVYPPSLKDEIGELDGSFVFDMHIIPGVFE